MSSELDKSLDTYPEIKVLFDGYSESNDSGSFSRCNCTCTLIKGPPHIIVDTMTAWDGPRLQAALEAESINCKDIEYVICTHGHSDHIGCNYLFQSATHIVGYSISQNDRYYSHDFAVEPVYIINNNVKILATPGHTLQDVSVIVTTSNGKIAITGDFFEKAEDIRDDKIWKDAGSDSEVLQLENRKKILQMVDFIIPGHGPMFNVKTAQKEGIINNIHNENGTQTQRTAYSTNKY